MPYQRVTDAAHFAGLVKQARAKGAAHTNCYLLQEEAAGLIQRGRLLYENCAAGLLLLEDMDRVYKLSFYLIPGAPVSFKRQVKPTVMEIIAKEHRKPAFFEEAARVWTTAGFTHNETFTRMRLALDENFTKTLEPSENMDYNVIIARPEHTEVITRIWEQTFDPVKNLLPGMEMTRELIGKGEILCAVTPDGTVAGVLQARFAKTTGSLWHIAVRPQFRGGGVGRALSLKYLETAARRGIFSHILWIVSAHENARRFHEKQGYRLDGTYIEQYILDEEMHNGKANGNPEGPSPGH